MSESKEAQRLVNILKDNPQDSGALEELKKIDKGLTYLDVTDPEGLKERLDKLSMKNFIAVVDESLERSGYTRDDIDYLGLIRMKRSAFEYVANSLGVHPYEQSTYFEEWGHMGQNDSIVSLEEGLKDGKIKEGDVVVLTAAGIGWSWNAMTIKWGKQE
jgi:3-oxoacyl-[acyl-carrier-protein] synthase-3